MKEEQAEELGEEIRVELRPKRRDVSFVNGGGGKALQATQSGLAWQTMTMLMSAVFSFYFISGGWFEISF